MIKGSCLCAQVTYTIDGRLGPITHCHCRTCRKAHAAAFSSVAAVKADDFNITTGKELLKAFESSPGKQRYFCSNCGSHIYAHRRGQAHYVLRLGTLDEDPGVRPKEHIWLSEKAPWYDIDTDCHLARHAQWPTQS